MLINAVFSKEIPIPPGISEQEHCNVYTFLFIRENLKTIVRKSRTVPCLLSQHFFHESRTTANPGRHSLFHLKSVQCKYKMSESVNYFYDIFTRYHPMHGPAIIRHRPTAYSRTAANSGRYTLFHLKLEYANTRCLNQ